MAGLALCSIVEPWEREQADRELTGSQEELASVVVARRTITDDRVTAPSL
jgi:hypothetical protein